MHIIHGMALLRLYFIYQTDYEIGKPQDIVDILHVAKATLNNIYFHGF